MTTDNHLTVNFYQSGKPADNGGYAVISKKGNEDNVVVALFPLNLLPKDTSHQDVLTAYEKAAKDAGSNASLREIEQVAFNILQHHRR